MSEINPISVLAIVIPAYKCRYFGQALESIANQTCKNFTLYIGDDSSPDDLLSIVNRFKNDIRIVYKRFSENLGGKDLVAQWERCIDLIKDEEWVWLFSDDDVMSNDCVEGFYEFLAKYNNKSTNNKVFRFNLSVVDADLNLLQKYVTPQDFSVEYFLESFFIDHILLNKAVEFIFSKKAYNEKGRFVNFPLAWGSDTATMLKFGQTAGFVTIEKGNVLWRDSGHNISSSSDTKINRQKPFITSLFLMWIIDFIRVYKGSKFHKKLIYSILYIFPSLPPVNNIKEIYKEKDQLYYKIPIWIVYIKIKRILRLHKIKMLIMNYLNRIDIIVLNKGKVILKNKL